MRSVGRRPGPDPRADHLAAHRRSTCWARSRWRLPSSSIPERVDLRPLESLASHTARALDGLKQVEEIRRLNRSQEQQAAELVKSAAALREQTRILQLVLDCMREGVVVADRESRLLVFNPAAERILGRNSSLAATDRWNPLYQVYRPDRVTPYATEDLPLFRAIRGSPWIMRSFTSPIPACKTGHGCWSMPDPCGMTRARSRGEWSSSTTSPAARMTSGGLLSSMPRLGYSPRSIL